MYKNKLKAKKIKKYKKEKKMETVITTSSLVVSGSG